MSHEPDLELATAVFKSIRHAERCRYRPMMEELVELRAQIAAIDRVQRERSAKTSLTAEAVAILSDYREAVESNPLLNEAVKMRMPGQHVSAWIVQAVEHALITKE